MKNVVDNLSKHYKYNVLELVELYAKGMSISEMVEASGLSERRVRTIISVLQLRLKNKHRAEDYTSFKSKLHDAATPPDKHFTELSEELELMYKQNKRLSSLLHKSQVESRIANKRLTTFTNVENIIELIADTVPEIKPTKATWDICITDDKESLREGLSVILSDLHIGEYTSKDNVPYSEGFNYKIAEERLKTLAIKILSFPKQSNYLDVFVLGDLIKGVIHNGLNESEESFAVSLVQCVTLLTQFLTIVSVGFDKVRVHWAGGNHDRLTESPAIKQKYQDYSFVIYEMLKKSLDTSQFMFNISPTSFITAKINEANIFAAHGDSFRNYKPTDDGQVSKVMDICEQSFGVRPKHIFTGHYHTPTTVTNHVGGVCIVNGSLNGTSEYALHSGFRGVKASQCILFVEANGDIETIAHTVLN